MDILISLIVIIVVGICIFSLWLSMFGAGADLAKEIIKTAIRESRDDSGNWDDIK